MAPFSHAPVTDALDNEAAAALFTAARTARNWAAEPVSTTAVHAAYDLAKWGPTAMNTVPLRYAVMDSPASRERLVPLVAEGNRERVATAPLTIVCAADPNFHETMPRLSPTLSQYAETLAGDLAARRKIAHTNAVLQAGYFILALRAVGLDVGPMNGMDAAAIDAEFFADTGWESFLIINAGRSAGSEDAYRPRGARLTAAEASQVF